MSADRRIQPQTSLLTLSQRVIDATAIIAALVICTLWSGQPRDEHAHFAAAGVTLLYHLVSEFFGLYRSWRGASLRRELALAFTAWCVTFIVILVVVLTTGYDAGLGRTVLVQWAIVAPAILLTARAALRWFVRLLLARGYNRRGFAIVGMTDLGVQLAKSIEASPHMGLTFEGFYDDRRPERVGTPTFGKHVGTIDDLVDRARRGEIDMIYITLPMRAEARIKRVLEALSDTTASVYFAPNFFVFELLHSRWTDVGGLPVVSIFENPFYGADGFLKRGMDTCLASLMLMVAAIPMLIIALAIKLTSPGPVFFRQRRYGLDGRDIRVWKFRTMRVCEDGPTVTQAKKDDPRVTPIGAFLRRTSLDELPQLFNVLKGEMSLVGPRPHAAAHNEEFRRMIQGYMLRHKVKPGITGLAQVNGARGETDTLEKMQQRIAYDHQYIREWSPWTDIKILFKTIFVVLSKQNAY